MEVAASPNLRPATVRYSERGLFIGLECDLLGQHVIAKRKIPRRTEAPDRDPGALAIKFVDIHIPVAANAVARAAMRSPHFEIFVALQLRDLLGR